MNLLIVVILHKLKIKDSETLTTLFNQLTSINNIIFIYDNSSINNLNDRITLKNVIYKSFQKNFNLYQHYTDAYNFARNSNIEWILFLDQDTNLPNNFIKTLESELIRLGPKSNIAGVLPLAFHALGDEYFSPSSVLPGGIHRPFRLNNHLFKNEISAVGSGATIRVSAIKDIGGFDPKYNLDSLDRVMFKKLHDHKKRFLISSNKIIHKLSTNELFTVNIKRYKKILHYEYRFMFDYKNRSDILIYLIRLLIRVVKLDNIEKKKVAKKYAKKTIIKYLYTYFQKNQRVKFSC